VTTKQGNSGNPVLSTVSPQELLRLQDKQLEKELNDVSADNWSTDSQESFVDTTQQVREDRHMAGDNNIESDSITHINSPIIQEDIRKIASVPIVGEASKTDESIQTPDRVVRDMTFLKESWANMTEADDALQIVDDTSLIDNSNEQGFQIQMSKNQKKAQKKLKQSSKDSYATRSKVPPKPFK
jgi:hypothetical protein